MRLPSIESIYKPYEHIYLSPHLDDVALSCGGRIVKQRSKGENVLVVTVFTGDIGEYKKPRDKILEPFMNTQMRRGEDERAMERLGVDYLWLNYPEALYRYKSPFALFRSNVCVSSAESRFCEALRSDICKICSATHIKRLYMPLAVGQHIDHQIVFQIGSSLQAKVEHELELCYYEELPYVLIPNLLKCRMKRIGINIDESNPGNIRTPKKPIMKEIMQVCKAIFNMPFIKKDNLLQRVINLLFLIFYIMFVIYLPKPRGGILQGKKITQEICDVSSEMSEKLAAVFEYGSQLISLFGDLEAMRNSIERYSEAIGGTKGQLLERYWVISK
ncbi:MAG: PIG-L family deacetylase [Candidatus Dadabacteria bacterium]|nr:PIG-L family deacetylase [Candidatus Dadabacteria bacterium]